MISKRYQLPPGIMGFSYLRNRDGSVVGIKNTELNYFIIFRPNGRPPRSGILLCQSLNSVLFKNDRVLDVGTGESALLAIHAIKLGAKGAIGIDIDPTAIKWAYKNTSANGLSKKISLRRIALRNYKPDSLFNVIVANPPQMPSKESKFFHDDGGKDGRRYIYQIINFAARFLKPKGLLVFTAFDFLGINISYNNRETIFDFLKQKGFSYKIVKRFQKVIKENSYTNLCLPWIRKQYPSYVFRKNHSGDKTHLIYVIAAKKV